jgi:hypothetical protein
MKCLRQPRFLAGKPVQIANVLDVHLSAEQWRTIVHLARKRRQTFSMMTRFCVLRLANKCHLVWTKKLERAHQEAKVRISRAPTSGPIHRHQMCLYGDDEKLIRVAAMDLGITMSAFIRLALELYLPLLAMEKQSRRYVAFPDLVENAIRLVQTITIFASKAGPYPELCKLHCWPWDLDSYW